MAVPATAAEMSTPQGKHTQIRMIIQVTRIASLNAEKTTT